MTRVVLDTNVLVSAVLVPNGLPARILAMVYDGTLQLIFSPATITEFVRVFSYPRLKKRLEKQGIALVDLDEFIAGLASFSTIVLGEMQIDAIPDHPSDNMFLNCAVEGEAKFIVSGDHHLLNLQEYQGIRIVSPSSFLKILGLPKTP